MAKKQKKQTTIQQQLIAAVLASPHSQKKLAKLADIQQPHLNAFVNGHRGMSLASINKLCAVLELELTHKPKN